jgi:type I restriction enzyme M protein
MIYKHLDVSPSEMICDKYAGQLFAPNTIPKGASFKDMVVLKGKPDIGDQINKKIIAPLANANKLSDMPDFNDVSSSAAASLALKSRSSALPSLMQNRSTGVGYFR